MQRFLIYSLLLQITLNIPSWAKKHRKGSRLSPLHLPKETRKCLRQIRSDSPIVMEYLKHFRKCLRRSAKGLTPRDSKEHNLRCITLLTQSLESLDVKTKLFSSASLILCEMKSGKILEEKHEGQVDEDESKSIMCNNQKRNLNNEFNCQLKI
ncbi:MAG: hypothetical protein MHMPM18_002310 [Marteilia pararefringens]